MSSILPIHQRLAEFYIKHSTNQQLTEDEEKELYLCLQGNANYCYRMAYFENLSLMASMTNDTDWAYEISIEIDNHMG